MKQSRKIIGYGALGLSAVSIFVGMSPIFPIFGEAFFMGAVFFAVGAWVLAGPELRDSLRRAWKVTREARRASRRGGSHAKASGVPIDPLIPVRILKLAKEHAGILTVAEVAMELNLPLDVAEAGLTECVRVGNALPDYDIPRALPIFRFPEFLKPETPQLSR